MAVTQSDLRTFASALTKERQPDFDIIVKDFRWSVHSHVISSHGSFRKICRDAPENGKGRHEVHLDDDEPVIIAHLILWLYTEEYDDENMSEIAGFDVKSLLKHGKVSPPSIVHAPDRAGSGPAAGVNGAREETDIDCCADELPPISLHAKMYLVAHKYGITDLSEKAVYEITEILGAVKEALLPCLAHFFVTDSSPALDLDSMMVDVDHGNKRSILPRTTTNGEKEFGATTTNTPTATTGLSSKNCSPPAAKYRHAISEHQDPELWKVLAETTSQHFLSYHTDPQFQRIITCNPRFHWAVMSRVAGMLEAAQDQLAKSTLASEKPPPKVTKKRGRKKQENVSTGGTTTPSNSSEPAAAAAGEEEDNKNKGKESATAAGVHAPKKLKKDQS
ncbi:uncharacterized protein Z520_06605 [Fonsecaea multimorphosa CBS 102226]|uniref:BTB domain-containing protein n=1 Tax=Fonsecaea multimorphosa CBS 102226 TaxID=1442371 RepID=A0A0D2JWC7_9EURO|nr:uncharacterized protein Z520_06605 [Fonsecaea multimorphosa CBS 102226]KIX97827.1 hypothetical protein Z520_06605 [Fonsecaea multimorphosa CBS 102226]OAL23597.1 hypothetical protein AYO22_06174 [Fonsecaea multimorphosa]